MILILSEYRDESTSDVIEWLYYFKKKFIRINKEQKIQLLKLELGNFSFEFNSKIVNSSEIEAFWYRRGHFAVSIPIKEFEFIEIKKNLISEFNILFEMVYKILDKKKKIGSYFNSSLNKLSVIESAKNIGMKIPDTLVTCEKKDLINFSEKHKGNIITKSIDASLFIENNNKMYMIYTEKIEKELINELPNTFGLSLFQNNVEKKYEIRTFFLNECFYSMAIFSQSDEQTKTDFRKYNWIEPNRTVPFKLPFEIENKLCKLFDEYKLNTGSVDLVINSDGEYIFLEINPIGQFGMVSIPCNYPLEYEIAKYLG